ncbi:MAG: leucine-rich repeat domain-containing protein [Salinivirgaceae bacterium]|nr:leucine-rich repeat domain-containing protein [Salinivirgaceae bacterium]
MKRTLLLFVSLFAGQTWAYDFKCGDLYYNITSDRTVEVTYQDYSYENDYSDLTAVNVPETVTYSNKVYTVTSIGAEAFIFSYNLESVTLPNTIKSIGGRAFGIDAGFTCDGRKLKSINIPNSVTTIGNGAFCGNDVMTSFTIPNSVVSIGEGAFIGCDNLEYNEYDNAYYLGNDDNPYLWLIMAKSTDIASCEINNKCRYIYDDAFLFCTNLVSITIPNSVISIGSGAFSACRNLVSINIPNSVVNIDGWAFNGCYSLKSLTIPDSVTNISTFWECENLTSVSIPNSIVSISGNFSGCNNLQYNEYNNAYYVGNSDNPYYALIKTKSTDITSCEISSQCKVICDDCEFNACKNLKYNEYDNAYYLGTADNPYFVLIKAKSTDITSCEINSQCQFIGSSAFSNCKTLTYISIPNSVKAIGSYAFGEAGLKSIIIPNSVVSIGGGAFIGCERLDSIVIPQNVKYVGGCLFSAWGGSGNPKRKVIYCETDSFPINWSLSWNYLYTEKQDKTHFVVWGHKSNNSNPSEDIQNGNNNETNNNAENQETETQPTNPVDKVAQIIDGIINHIHAIITDDEEVAANEVNIYAYGNTIIVENTTDEIFVYNAMGRLVCRDEIYRVRAELPIKDTGVYIVKTGNIVKRVVVN